LKEAILLAAELEGSDGEGKDELVGFLRKVAKEDLRAFVSLLGRVLPLQVESRTDMRSEVTYRTVEEVLTSWRTAALHSMWLAEYFTSRLNRLNLEQLE
jgi:hypothetical protein